MDISTSGDFKDNEVGSLNEIKKTKRLHHLYQDWLKIKKLKINESPQYLELRKQTGIKYDLFSQPMSGKWYYTYSNDKEMTVGLAKLQDSTFMFSISRKIWMWETCTANEELELRRFPTQKAAEEVIYQFLK